VQHHLLGARVDHWQCLARHGIDPLAINQQLQQQRRAAGSSSSGSKHAGHAHRVTVANQGSILRGLTGHGAQRFKGAGQGGYEGTWEACCRCVVMPERIQRRHCSADSADLLQSLQPILYLLHTSYQRG
jgi:hypothetical protein